MHGVISERGDRWGITHGYYFAIGVEYSQRTMSLVGSGKGRERQATEPGR